MSLYLRVDDRSDRVVELVKNLNLNMPHQDLRCVLKAGVSGVPSCPMPQDLIQQYQSSVVWAQKGVVSSAGLLPLKGREFTSPDVRVKTIYGGDRWVIRPLLPREVVAVLDIPEQMLLDSHSPGEIELIKHLTVPIKGLQVCIQLLAQILPEIGLRDDNVKRQL